ncbi:Bifunctional protein FolD protein [Baekduia alba]|uniref:bifunctional methylenetetrahydrofolate dehydrogenase/methenyltetrahydrofolate cyclohydrolase FolD n=1 Tax=Baekduia alba TaxID=2997333 RepID=UPI00233FAC0F|nr:bifunctional methylenetetrahydrofolate dehydrogenase/methenyltetrahydrofolate cyclohydrolase FolD [Baekduia alba]WCB94884.1 Bifunctional protein FolD protein [Baekduia alba]
MALDTAIVIDGKAVAARVRADVAAQVRGLASASWRTPGLATILIGDDPASAVYVAAKRRACAEVGIQSFHHALPGDVTRAEVLALVDRLNADADVSGILCQLPVPAHLDGAEITNRIAPDKDVDGLTTVSAGRLALGLPGLRPCTPAGVMVLLAEAGVELRGAVAVVLGRSNLFGKPMGQMLLAADATVIASHSRTVDLPSVCLQADVLIAAVGRPGMVTADWVKPGATVVDVGINRTGGGLVGDVDFDRVKHVAGAITPVPGGVGPMTIACLLRNTLLAAGADGVSRRSA